MALPEWIFWRRAVDLIWNWSFPIEIAKAACKRLEISESSALKTEKEKLCCF
jgi:hypothetical protein